MDRKEWLGWHFLPPDKRLRYGTREVVEVGKSITIEGPLRLCVRGLHASARAIDALSYAPLNAKYACRVRLSGEIVGGGDKAVANTREVLWMVDATRVLHLFACQVAEDAMSRHGNGDRRSLAAIQAKRDWLEGKISNKELRVAARSDQNTLLEKMLEEARDDYNE